jgi:hypothetical protein
VPVFGYGNAAVEPVAEDLGQGCDHWGDGFTPSCNPHPVKVGQVVMPAGDEQSVTFTVQMMVDGPARIDSG